MKSRAVGVLGGGQLGVMLGESLLHLNAEVHVLDPDPESPALARLPHVATAGYDDPAALLTLFGQCDVVTFDSENIPFGPLLPHAQKLLPSLDVLATSQDRAKEKGFLAKHGFPVVAHQPVAPNDDLAAAARAFGFPCIAKSVLGGYDGKGQFKLESEADLKALPARAAGGWVLEERLPLRPELSCIVARDGQGGELCFPVFENLHTDHILDLTVVPARIPVALEEEAKDLALHAIAAHHGRARPHFRVVESSDPELKDDVVAALVREVPLRFDRLQRRYGRWGLAWIESILRAADVLGSEEEEVAE